MRTIVFLMVMILCSPSLLIGQRLTPPRKYHADDEDDEHPEIDENEELDVNGTDKGMYVGTPCEFTCSAKLLHVYCNPVTGVCECEKKYPVKLNPSTGCGKPKRLGEQCYYREACSYSDRHSSCIQIHHNAVCQCKNGYHSVSIQKPSKRIFCAEDVEVLTTNYSTLAGVLSGIAVLSGLICFVLHLFNQNRYSGRHRFGNANLAPPIFFSNDPGFSLSMPIIDHDSTSRASSQPTLASISSRRASSVQGCRGFSIPTSRAGSRRPSLTSVHSGSSIHSYSTRRFDRERELKEEREMQRRLARMTSAMTYNGRIPPTPSPRSTDELLPTLTEDKPVPLAIQEEESGSTSFQDDIPSTSKQYP